MDACTWWIRMCVCAAHVCIHTNKSVNDERRVDLNHFGWRIYAEDYLPYLTANISAYTNWDLLGERRFQHFGRLIDGMLQTNVHISRCLSVSRRSQRLHTVQMKKIHTDAEYKVYRLINNGDVACILRCFSLRHINNLSCFSFDWQIIEYHGWSERTVSAVRCFEYAYTADMLYGHTLPTGYVNR